MRKITLDDQEKTYLSALRRDFHRNPELGLREFRTAGRIEEELDRTGIPHIRVGETGVLGTLRGTAAGGAVVLRADIDALPIQELPETEYRSQTSGVMHACGHDAHTTCLLGAARLLSRHRADFGGEVRFVFQPAEEIGKGALDFVEAGVLKGADRVFGLHVAPELPIGTVGLKPGLNNAAVDHFRIAVQGRSAHVATPQLGADALYIASQTVVALQALVTRLTSPVEPVIIGVGTLNAGTAYNAVAASAVLQGTTRTISQERRERVREQIDRTARNIADIYGGTAEVEWMGVTPPLINDPQACREAAAAAQALGEDLRVITDRSLSLCGDNFAEYLLHVPGAYAYLGSGNPALPNTEHSIHSADFDLDENTLTLGAELCAAYALSVLTGNAEM